MYPKKVIYIFSDLFKKYYYSVSVKKGGWSALNYEKLLIASVINKIFNKEIKNGKSCN